ncbi:putative T7SS-secreted protein [Lapillicoccus sp.]|uniref:putative T7SS-secreted protein n=1 Tax=Lapillicoccus sp. TaxID=1909287 RepID=UPI0025CCDFF6|nr:hypothetical protein [Lapillicoccus sp.]
MRDAYADLLVAVPVEQLVPGDPVGIDQLAQRMLRWSDLFADAAQALRRIDVVWTGPAADAFQSEFQLQPGAFASAAAAMDDAGYALGSYGIAFHSAREGAVIALETFQRGLRDGLAARAAAKVLAAAAGGVLPTTSLLDLRDEPAGLQDRLTGVEKLTAVREAVLEAGDRATTVVRVAMALAPRQVTALEHGANFAAGMLPWVSNSEKTDFYVGGARGLLDMGSQAMMPVVAPLVMSPVNRALDGLEWRWNISSGSGFHQAGALVIPALATGGGGGVAVGLEARAPRAIADTILPKDVNPEPVLLYRGMTSSADGYPLTGATAKTLGARPKIWVPEEQGDIVIDPNGGVWPDTGGMSANTDLASIPPYRRPLAFGGTGKDLNMFTLEQSALPEGLIFHPDPHKVGHGFVEPTRPMSYDDMQRLIHSTQFSWRKVYPPE